MTHGMARNAAVRNRLKIKSSKRLETALKSCGFKLGDRSGAANQRSKTLFDLIRSLKWERRCNFLTSTTVKSKLLLWKPFSAHTKDNLELRENTFKTNWLFHVFKGLEGQKCPSLYLPTCLRTCCTTLGLCLESYSSVVEACRAFRI